MSATKVVKHLPVPSIKPKAAVINLRKTSRIDARLSEGLMASIHLNTGTISAKVFDFSSTGISLIIDAASSEHFKPLEKVDITNSK